MRNCTLFIPLLLLTVSLSAQEKGQLLIGGSLGFNKTKAVIYGLETKNTNIYVTPSMGKFYRKNRVAGINLLYQHQSYNDKNLNGHYYGLGFFLRQYQPLGKSFYLFAEEGISGTKGSYSSLVSSNSYSKSKEEYANIYFFPGIAYGINKRLQLEIGMPELITLGYYHFSSEFTDPLYDKNSRSYLYMNSGLSKTNVGYLTFGMKWLITK
jgi:hypothetical protein